MKKHENPRTGFQRNTKGTGGSARARQLKKKFKRLKNDLKRNDAAS